MKPVEGSSRITMGGFPIIAIATDNFRLLPPLSEYDGLSANLHKSNSVNFSLTIYQYNQTGLLGWIEASEKKKIDIS